jgi:hypothetical protein
MKNMGRKAILRSVVIPVGPSIAYVDLTKDRYALIDVEDSELCGRHNWSALWNPETGSFYAGRRQKASDGTATTVYLHRVILNCPRDLIGDHIFLNTLDNRRSQLRIVEPWQSAVNRRRRSDNVSGLVGISQRDNGKWRARITVSGTCIHLGDRETKEEAVALREAAAKIYHADFSLKLAS